MNKPNPPRAIYEVDRDLQQLRSDYDGHLIFGKWGSMIAIAIFLLIRGANCRDRLVNSQVGIKA